MVQKAFQRQGVTIILPARKQTPLYSDWPECVTLDGGLQWLTSQVNLFYNHQLWKRSLEYWLRNKIKLLSNCSIVHSYFHQRPDGSVKLYNYF
jgi:hypothetical protein